MPTDSSDDEAQHPPDQRPGVRDKPNRLAEHPAGINIDPSCADDGWVSPPPVTLNDGTTVQLYKDGEALLAAHNAIQNAKRRICLEVYIFASDATGEAFAELLSKKSSEGVSVYVLYDDIGSLTADRKIFRRMRASGVKLQAFHPIRPWECRYGWKPFNRNHRKLLVIDNEIAGMGGLNVGREYAGSWIVRDQDANVSDFWRDNAIGLRGPAAREFQKSFAKSWHYAANGGRLRKTQFQYNLDAIEHPHAGNELSILASSPSLDSPLRPVLHKLFGGARRSIQMTMAYFAPDDDLIDALCRAAKRGVKVQLMLPSRTDVHLLIIAARSFYEKLLAAGVEIFERQSVVLHTKTMTIDNEISVVGSANLDYRSIEYNLELSTIIRSRQFGAQMNALFRNDIHFSKRINLNEWRKRPWSDRLIQWMVSRARYLL
jgi:cardiolipin synthase